MKYLLFITVTLNIVIGDIPLPQQPLDHPMIIVPQQCQILRMSSFSSIILVPLIDDNINQEWILFVRYDNNIWDYDIPPTPFTTIKQYKAKKIKRDSEFFSTVSFEINDVEIPSFVHLSIRLIDKETGFHNISFDTASIIIRLTNQSSQQEMDNILDLYQNSQLHQNKIKNEYSELQTRYDTISKQYKELIKNSKESLPKKWDDKYLSDSFKDAVNKNEIQSLLNPTDSSSVFKITNIFSDEFLNGMRNEIKIAKGFVNNGEIELFRPNSMNNDGFVLKELGFGPFFDEFMNKWILKLTSSISPFYLWCGERLDYNHGFTIRYTTNELDRNLSRHLDQSQITFNLCLHNDDSVGSKIWFNGVRDDIYTINENISISLSTNEAIIHSGQHWHSTEDIENGERINLILWFRSPFCRNSISESAFNVCPDLIPIPSNLGKVEREIMAAKGALNNNKNKNENKDKKESFHLNLMNGGSKYDDIKNNNDIGDDLTDSSFDTPLNEDEAILELEHQISELIRNGRSGCHASFRYSHQGPKVRTKLVTWNPKHRSTFLVHETEARSRIDALRELLMYVKDKIRDQEKPFTVKWYLKNTTDCKLVTSHFYAQDIYNLLDKFYYDKNRDDYEIVEIKLNPST